MTVSSPLQLNDPDFTDQTATLSGLFYYVVNRANQAELWRSDGSDVNTRLIDSATHIHSLTATENRVYYVTSNATGGENLAVIDDAGTQRYYATSLTSVTNLTDVAGTLYFTAVDGADGIDLWKWSGFDVERVRDFEGQLDSGTLGQFASVDDQLFFIFSPESGSSSLWTSDGSASGTFEVVSLSSTLGNPAPLLVSSNETLFYFDSIARFTLAGVTEDARLWRVNTVDFIPVLVKTIPLAAIENVVDVNGTLFFSAWGASSQSDVSLWKSDGTETGTLLVKDIDQRNFSSGASPANFVVVNHILYFTADDEIHGKELWRSDGTPSGTYMFRDMYPNYAGGFADSPANLLELNGSLYFTARSPEHNMALWKSDGITTTLISSLGSAPLFLSAVKTGTGSPSANAIYYGLDRFGDGISLYATDGTAEHSHFVRDTGIASLGMSSTASLADKLFYIPSDGIDGTSVWTSDGTNDGTQLLIGSTPFGSQLNQNWKHASNLFVFHNSIYFVIDDGQHGEELWYSDGTLAGTELFADLIEGRMSSNPRQFTIVGGAFYFTTHEGSKLWKSDGTAAGTVELIPSVLTEPGNRVTGLLDVDGTLFFVISEYQSNDRSIGQTSLWKSDGTESGTTLVRNLYFPLPEDFDLSKPRPSNVLADDFFSFGGVLFFSAEDGIHGRELWRSDGTSEGTFMLYDINHEFGVHTHLKSNPRGFTEANGVLYFTADDGTHGRELWTTDGTSSGTRMVANIRSDFLIRSSSPSSLTAFKNYVVFSASDGGFEGTTDASGDGFELWRSDGTAQGTEQIKDINPGPSNSTPIELKVVGDDLYFSAFDAATGYTLWKSDGLLNGTQQVDVLGQTWSRPHNLVNVNGTLYFVSGRVLWSLAPTTPSNQIAYKQHALVLNQDRLGYIGSATSGDRWVFAGNANDRVRFDLGQTFGQVRFRLSGPQGFIAFEDLATDSGTITLPFSGTFALEAYLVSGATGSYSFRVDQVNFTPLQIGETYQGNLPGTGFTQMFQISVPEDGVLAATYDNAQNTDNIEIYMRRGLPPTRNVYDLRRSKVGADHTLWLADARAGTWYVLIYAEHAPSAGGFSLRLDNPPVLATAITPTAQPNFDESWLTISGGGFDESTTVEFIDKNGSSRVPLVTETVDASSLRVLLDVGNWSVSDYRVVVHKATFTSQLAIPFVVTQEPYKLETKLIVPERVGFNIPIRQTIWIEYVNSGRLPMPAPLLKLTGNNGARLTADEKLAIPKPGYGSILNVGSKVQVLGLGKSNMPWLLMPGESNRIPVYYLGLSEGGYPQVNFRLETLTTQDGPAIDWEAQESIIRPKELDQETWRLAFQFMQSVIGQSWGEYAETLANVAHQKLEESPALTSLGLSELWHDIVGNVLDFVNLIERPASLGLVTIANVPQPPFCSDDAVLNDRHLELLVSSSSLLSERHLLNSTSDSMRTEIGQFVSTFMSLVMDATLPIVDRIVGLIGAAKTASISIEAKDAILEFLNIVASDGLSAFLKISSGKVIEGINIFDAIAAAGLTPPLSNFLSEFQEGQEYVDTLSEFRFFAQTAFSRIDSLSHNASLLNDTIDDFSIRVAAHNVAVTDYDLQNAACVNNFPLINIQGTTVIEGDEGMPNGQVVPPTGTFAVVDVVLSERSISPVTFRWTTTGGFVNTARPGEDYVASSGTAEFVPGTTHTQILVPIVGDGKAEGIEYFFVYISSPQHGVINAGVASARIIDDDSQGDLPNFPAGASSEIETQTVGSFDPNDIIGPAGYGPQRFIPADSALAYTIRFENESDASAPAREITITNQLDSNLDLDTFELTEVSFANHTLFIPPGRDLFESTEQMEINGHQILVQVFAGIDRSTRQLTVTLRGVDALTGWFSADPLVGLLHPEDGSGHGQGSVSYLVRPQVGLRTGTVIANRAEIIFDFNRPIDTPLIHNTLDAVAPTSRIVGLPESTNSPQIAVQWSGTDDPDGAGVGTYNLFVSDNDGPFHAVGLRLSSTTQTFVGVVGHTYRFYTVAIDNVGHQQADSEVSSSIFILPDTWQNHREHLDVNDDNHITPIDVLLIIDRLNQPGNVGPLPLPTLLAYPAPFLDVSGDGHLTAIDALLVINYLNVHSGEGEGEQELHSVAPAADGLIVARVTPPSFSVPFVAYAMQRRRPVPGPLNDELVSLLAMDQQDLNKYSAW